MRRRFCILLAMIMVFCLLPMSTTAASAVWDGTAATSFDSGTGTVLDPYVIMTPEQLAYLRNRVSGGHNFSGEYVRVGDDLVLNDTTNWQTWSGTVSPTNTWTPIGSFFGTFDGGNHTISGMYVNTTADAGLFAYSGGTSTIKNIGIIDSYIKGGYNTGAIVGSSYGSIINCYNTGTVAGEYAAGIVGSHFNYGVEASKCWNTGTIIGINRAGGISAYASSGPSFEFCRNEGEVTVTGTDGYAGGLIGVADSGVFVNNCYNAGSISAPLGYAGGLTGLSATFTNSYNAGAVTGVTNKTGLITGGADDSASYSNTYYLDDATPLVAVGEHTDWSATPITTTYNLDLSGTAPLTAAQMQVQTNFAGYDFTDVWTMAGDATYLYPELQNMPTLPEPEPPADIWDGTSAMGFDSGTGTEIDPYIIMTPGQLAYFRDQVNGGRTFSGEYVRVGADLVLNDTTSWQTWSGTVAPTNTWTPIGTSYSIYFGGTFDGGHHTISGMYVNTTSYAGLFGYTISLTIKNLGVIESYIYSSGEYSLVGSIVGNSYGAILNCYNTATIVGYGAGGICGCCETIINCWNTGTITGTGLAGGITAETTSLTKILYCYNKGTVTGGSYAGGILANATRDGTYKNCYNAGPITSTTGYAGGIFGDCDTTSVLVNNYNSGSVTGAENKTGLIGGRIEDYQAVVRNYYRDDGSGLHAIGELYDRNNDPNTTYNQDLDGTMSITAAQMQDANNFVHWDFDNVWTMEGDGDYLYPELMLPVTTMNMTVTTLGGAAKKDKTAIRFGASISFANLTTLNEGDYVEFGFRINGLRNNALTSANWTELQAGVFACSQPMRDSATTEELVVILRTAGIKVYSYDADTITFAIILNNMPLAAQDSLWVFEPYVIVKERISNHVSGPALTSLGTAKYTSVNRILGDIASGTYVA